LQGDMVGERAGAGGGVELHRVFLLRVKTATILSA
jgi:hypothetical protein